MVSHTKRQPGGASMLPSGPARPECDPIVIQINDTISLADDEIQERFVRASGPGGQHVNKTSTAVELRFDVRNSPSLPDYVKTRLEALAGSRLTLEGILVLFAQSARSQEMNRQEAKDRLVELIRQAIERPKPRRATKPTLGSKMRRLEAKSQRSGIKTARARPRDEG
jgi:ribosome-associated protein